MQQNHETRESGNDEARPLAAYGYVRIVHRSRLWCIELVEPGAGRRTSVTKLGGIPSRAAAIDCAEHAAGRMQLSVRIIPAAVQAAEAG